MLNIFFQKYLYHAYFLVLLLLGVAVYVQNRTATKNCSSYAQYEAIFTSIKEAENRAFFRSFDYLKFEDKHYKSAYNNRILAWVQHSKILLNALEKAVMNASMAARKSQYVNGKYLPEKTWQPKNFTTFKTEEIEKKRTKLYAFIDSLLYSGTLVVSFSSLEKFKKPNFDLPQNARPEQVYLTQNAAFLADYSMVNRFIEVLDFNMSCGINLDSAAILPLVEVEKDTYHVGDTVFGTIKPIYYISNDEKLSFFVDNKPILIKSGIGFYQNNKSNCGDRRFLVRAEYQTNYDSLKIDSYLRYFPSYIK